jgi:hypothetical protein
MTKEKPRAKFAASVQFYRGQTLISPSNLPGLLNKKHTQVELDASLTLPKKQIVSIQYFPTERTNNAVISYHVVKDAESGLVKAMTLRESVELAPTKRVVRTFPTNEDFKALACQYCKYDGKRTEEVKEVCEGVKYNTFRLSNCKLESLMRVKDRPLEDWEQRIVDTHKMFSLKKRRGYLPGVESLGIVDAHINVPRHWLSNVRTRLLPPNLYVGNLFKNCIDVGPKGTYLIAPIRKHLVYDAVADSHIIRTAFGAYVVSNVSELGAICFGSRLKGHSPETLKAQNIAFWDSTFNGDLYGSSLVCFDQARKRRAKQLNGLRSNQSFIRQANWTAKDLEKLKATPLTAIYYITQAQLSYAETFDGERNLVYHYQFDKPTSKVLVRTATPIIEVDTGNGWLRELNTKKTSNSIIEQVIQFWLPSKLPSIVGALTVTRDYWPFLERDIEILRRRQGQVPEAYTAGPVVVGWFARSQWSTYPYLMSICGTWYLSKDPTDKSMLRVGIEDEISGVADFESLIPEQINSEGNLTDENS